MAPELKPRRIGFAIKAPQGWIVEALPGGITIVRSPDWQAFAIAEFVNAAAAAQKSASEILEHGLFHAAQLFPHAQPPKILEAPTPDSATALVQFTSRKGAASQAQLQCTRKGAAIVIEARAATSALHEKLLPILSRAISWLDAAAGEPAEDFNIEAWLLLLQTQGEDGKAAPGVLPQIDLTKLSPEAIRGLRKAPPEFAQHAPQSEPRPPAPAPKPYVPFTEPERGTFTMEVPNGWQTKGGFVHPMPGDRRPWFQALSPDGIYIACDPAIPQCLCHFLNQPEGQYAPNAAGGQLLNLKPSAGRYTDYYITAIASPTLGPLQFQQRRPRPDIVELTKAIFLENHIPLSPQWQITSDEAVFSMVRNGQPATFSVLTQAVFNGEYAMQTWGFWEANAWILIAPPHLAEHAEQIRTHMKSTCRITPRFMQIYQQDEAQIAQNANRAHMAQVNSFNQMQQMHNMQTAIGDSIIANYWRNH
jgi:hypothetical protein